MTPGEKARKHFERKRASLRAARARRKDTMNIDSVLYFNKGQVLAYADNGQGDGIYVMQEGKTVTYGVYQFAISGITDGCFQPHTKRECATETEAMETAFAAAGVNKLGIRSWESMARDISRR